MVELYFILSLADGPSVDHCQCAASLPRLIDDEMHLNHSPMMGLILAARFLFIEKPALYIIFGEGIIPHWLVRGEVWLLE
ncbi:MAG: hypothetical protein OEZ39_13940 [Gammaproteobacteria bacterium]|nr:hypothetical protein [Gammaproteobacteria bacterium]